MVLNVPVQRSATVSLSLQETLWPQLAASASNIANATTSGFKRVYTEAVEANYNAASSDSVAYVTVMNTNHDFTPGPLKPTGNPYDIAVMGTGFFQVEGGRLTQNGQFRKDDQGRIVTAAGENVLSDGGAEITIPVDSKFMMIGEDGSISNQNGVVAKLGVFTVPDTKTLQYTSDGYYIPQEAPLIDINPKVVQGYIMESNVNPMEETIKLIEIQRRYEQAEKLLKESYSLASKVVNVSARSSM